MESKKKWKKNFKKQKKLILRQEPSLIVKEKSQPESKTWNDAH